MKFSWSLVSLVHLTLAAQYTFAAQYRGYNSPNSFDINYLSAPRWMASLPSYTSLTELSIPGTHDTMTYAITSNIFQCQNHDLPTQLHAGIRYFDIRARLNSNTLFIYHEDVFTGSSYSSVLLTLFSFLEDNPGETILMRLKEEADPINSTIDFLTAFNNNRLSDPTTSPGCIKHFWIPETPGPTTVPMLGVLRGKILILQNFGSDPAEYGIKWESPLLSIEDYWVVPDLYEGLDAKFEAVIEGLENAGNGTEKRDGVLYLSHLSASEPVLPIEVAAGTRNGSVMGINDRTGCWLREGNGGVTGVVIMDFPGRGLVRDVFERN